MIGRAGALALPIARAAGRALRVVPDPLLRAAARVDRAAEPTPLADLVPATDVRLFIGPANSAGQAWQWSRAVERSGQAGAVSMSVQNPAGGFGFPVDQPVPLRRYRWSRLWARAQRIALEGGFTHVLTESGRPLFGDLLGASPEREVIRLRSAGLRVGLIFHGSDARVPSAHAARYAGSPYADSGWRALPLLELRARENLRLAERSGAPAFVSTPDLLDDLPEAAWLPVVIEPSRWAATASPLAAGVPVVAHAPSNAHIKGSDLVEPVLRRLEAEGLISYRRVADVPADEMPELYRGVDIVLDQFRLGAYGTTAVEAMAAGRLTMAHVRPDVRRQIRERTGLDVPVLEAVPSTLDSVLREAIGDRTTARSLAAEGPAFASAVHDGKLSADVLAPFLRS